LGQLPTQTAIDARAALVTMVGAGGTGIPATYCSVNANTPECCDTVWWGVWGSLMVPLLWIPMYVAGWVKDESIIAAGACGLVLQLIAFGFGIAVVLR
jgi:hypothetical protein